MKQKIPGYDRDFELTSTAGTIVRVIMYLSAIGFIILGFVLGTEQVGSRYSRRTEFNGEIFFPFLMYGIIVFSIGYVVARLVDIQHLKLILLELQTKIMLEEREKNATEEEKKTQ